MPQATQNSGGSGVARRTLMPLRAQGPTAAGRAPEELQVLAADAGRVPHLAATGLAHIKQPNYRRQPRT
jgi:hypothetical protein